MVSRIFIAFFVKLHTFTWNPLNKTDLIRFLRQLVPGMSYWVSADYDMVAAINTRKLKRRCIDLSPLRYYIRQTKDINFAQCIYSRQSLWQRVIQRFHSYIKQIVWLKLYPMDSFLSSNQIICSFRLGDNPVHMYNMSKIISPNIHYRIFPMTIS